MTHLWLDIYGALRTPDRSDAVRGYSAEELARTVAEGVAEAAFLRFLERRPPAAISGRE